MKETMHGWCDRLAQRVLGLTLAGGMLSAHPSNTSAQGFDDWLRPKVPILAVGGSGARGEVAFLTDASGDYRLRASVALPWPPARETQLSWAVASGTCADWTSGTGVPARRLLWRGAPTAYGAWTLLDTPVPRGWTDGPLILLGEEYGRGVLLACADLPLAEARAREPLVSARPGTAPIRAVLGWQVSGVVRMWPTPSGDMFARVEVQAGLDAYHRSGSVTDLLLWHVMRGRCDVVGGAPHDPMTQEGARVPLRFGEKVPPSGRRIFSLVVPRAEARANPLALAAYAHTENPLANTFVACADLPPWVAMLGESPATLPRAGDALALTGQPWISAAVGLALLVAGMALQPQAGKQVPRGWGRCPPGERRGEGHRGAVLIALVVALRLACTPAAPPFVCPVTRPDPAPRPAIPPDG